jgi:hypothetical protein
MFSLAILTGFCESLGVLRQQMQSKTLPSWNVFYFPTYMFKFGPYFLILKSLVQFKS